jgi:hypothetical protein
MGIFKSFKKSLITDAIVIVVIVLGFLIFFWITGATSVGWEIKKGTEVVRGEEKTTEENIYVHKGGVLQLFDSAIYLNSSDNLSIWIAGNGRLELEDSSIDTDDSSYTVSAYAEDGNSPDIIMSNSQLYGHLGLFLRDHSSLDAYESIIGKLVVMGRSNVSLTDSQVFLVLDSDREESYSGLKVGKDVNLILESREGWDLNIENSTIEGYQINIDEDDEIEIEQAEEVSLLFNLAKVGEDGEIFPLPTPSIISDGKIDDFGYELSWGDTLFNKFGFVLEESNLSVSNTKIGDILLTDSSTFSVGKSEIDCDICNLFDSTLVLEDVLFADDISIILNGSSVLEISNSDVSQIPIILKGSSSLKLSNCQYDEDNIDNRGTGEIKIT